jgi:hypothetical protein
MRKFISTFLVLALFLAIVNPVSVKAETIVNSQVETESLLTLPKDNYNFIEGEIGDTHMVYTYESNGSLFKVVEDASENFDKVNSTIYIEKDGQFVEYATQNVSVIDSVFTLTLNENGVITTEEHDFSEKNTESKNDGNYSINSTYNGEPVSEWVYEQHNGNNKITVYTIVAVVAIVGFIAVEATGGLAAGAAVTGVTAVASFIISEHLQYVYYSQYYAQRTSKVVPTMVVACKWETFYYADPSHTTSIGYTFALEHLNGYVD